MKSAEIREKFLKYFESHGHQRVKSSSLIPAADPTLLFTNAGMVQFKDCFLGLHDLGFKRATTSQKCVRAGGKHNDLENVGFTPRHHTFFEMLGNFSFGDYFKKDAIAFAWELLQKGLHIPKDKLRITVFEKDDEAFELWKAQGIPADWITRMGEKDNFWAMGDTGPCGPCTEIYYDWGKEAGCGKPTCTTPACPCGKRFLEIWNLVFMQYNRDSSGKLTPLPKPSVDTGSGLERVASVLQGVSSNYDTDLFQPIIQSIAKNVQISYGADPNTDVSMRVIADHLRSSTFLMADGVVASNEGRGYVLRRILRRAIRHGKKLGQDTPFLHKLVGSVADSLSGFYPELTSQRKLVETLMKEEEERFHETLHRGMGLLEENIAKLRKQKSVVLPGEVTFKLYDTFGFPLDLIEVICAENELRVDEKGFQTLMEKQRSLSTFHKDGLVWVENIGKTVDSKKAASKFLGYDMLATKGTLLHLFNKEGIEVPALPAGEQGYAIFDKSPFYAESGGQVGDKGTVFHAGTEAIVESTTKVYKVTLHHLKVSKGKLENGSSYQLSVNPALRTMTAINHTATHMLHAALRKVLGDRVKQAGSLVDPDRLRFDFTYPRSVTEEEIEQIEKLVTDEIWRSSEVSVQEMNYDEAMKTGALAFFDEKYGDTVRVIRVGDTSNPFSVELCGGTHLTNTIQIGLFKIISETSVASGVRRIEAVTSQGAIQYLTHRSRLLGNIEKSLGTKGDSVTDKIENLLSANKALQKETESLKLKLAQGSARASSSGGKEPERVGGYQLHTEHIESADAKILRAVVDQYRDKMREKGVVALATENDGKVAICVGLTKDVVGKLDAGKLVKELAPLVGGSGGGRPDFAQAGGSNSAGIPAVFEKLREILISGT
jgi:alanyl-tRNA synthetase